MLDELLAGDSSSEDDSPAQKADAPGLLEGHGAKRDDQPGQASSQSQRPVLSVEEALAQGDLSDDEDEEAHPAATGHANDAPAMGDQLSDVSCDEADNADEARSKKGFDEILAMDSDTSDDNPRSAPARARPPCEPARSAAEAPQTGTAHQKKGQDDPLSADNLAIESFTRAPFSWCLEHERELLCSAIDEPVKIDHAATSTSCAEAVAAFSMVEAKPCAELQRMMAAQEFGLPTCVNAHSKLVGVGSTRGAVALLDPKVQTATNPPLVLSSPSTEEGVAVSAAAFSPDGSSMLVGHKNGQLVLWDLTTQKVASIVKDVHDCAVLSVAFCRPSWQYALSADAGGNIFFLTFTSTFGRRDCTRQLLLEQSSNIGITLRILPLPRVASQSNHPADVHCLVALCSTNATVLLTLHPSAQMLQKISYSIKDAGSVPDAAWLRLQTREWSDATRNDDPQLCIAFGHSLRIVRACFGADAAKVKEEFKISLSHRFTWDSPISSIAALNDSMLMIFDGAGKLSIVQLPSTPGSPGPSGSEAQQHLVPIHAEDVSGSSFVYHNHTSLEGSRDLHAYHGAFAVFGGRSRTVYMCGVKELWTLQVGRWGQHIEELVGKSEWSAALDVLVALHGGSLPPLLDFPHAMDARQKAVESRTTQVIQSYLVSKLLPNTPRASARQMCVVALRVCIQMKLWPVLYKAVFECFKSAGHMNVYCNTLEPFILHGKIPRGQMDSEVLSSILQSYSTPLEEEEQAAMQHVKRREADGSAPHLQAVDCDHCVGLFPVARRLQQLVLYVDVSQLDLNLALRLFTQHRLWTALMHVYCALNDYTSPLELLVGECTQLAKRYAAQPGDGGCPPIETPLLQCVLVRKLFYFLHRGFELRPFPLDAKDGPSMVHHGPKVFTDLLQSIFAPDAHADGKVKAPPMFLRLLRLSPFGLFSVLSVLYTSPSACHVVQSGAKDLSILGAPDGPSALHRIFLATEAAMGASRSQMLEDGLQLPPNTDAEFLWFFARAVCKIKLDLPADKCGQLVEHLLASQQPVGPASPSGLAAPPHFGSHPPEEAQQLLIGVFAAQESLDKERRGAFISKAMQKGFFGVASWLHERHGEYDRALDCQLQDSELREQIFEYIISRLAEKSGDEEDTAALVEATLQRLRWLVGIDAERCAVMVCEQLASVANHDSVLDRLKGYPQIELQYLETFLVGRRRDQWKTPEEQQAFFDDHVVRYMELLCSHSPSAVLPFVVENETLPLDKCLELCHKYSITDASVHLLERTGDFGAVLELVLNDFDNTLEQLHRALIDPPEQSRSAAMRTVKRLAASVSTRAAQSPCAPDAKPAAPWWEGCPDAQRCVEILDHAYELSSRNSNIMADEQLEELWFGVLGRTVRCQERVHADSAQERVCASRDASRRHSALAAALSELASQAMVGVLAYLSLPASLRWICAEFGSSALGLWKDPLQRMLSGLAFQQGLLRAAKAVAAQDVMKPFLLMKRRGSRGVRLSPESFPDESGGELRVYLGPKGVAAISSHGRGHSAASR